MRIGGRKLITTYLLQNGYIQLEKVMKRNINMTQAHSLKVGHSQFLRVLILTITEGVLHHIQTYVNLNKVNIRFDLTQECSRLDATLPITTLPLRMSSQISLFLKIPLNRVKLCKRISYFPKKNTIKPF